MYTFSGLVSVTLYMVVSSILGIYSSLGFIPWQVFKSAFNIVIAQLQFNQFGIVSVMRSVCGYACQNDFDSP